MLGLKVTHKYIPINLILCLTTIIFNLNLIFSQSITNKGINLTGLERSWLHQEKEVLISDIITELSALSTKNYGYFRIPIDFSAHLISENGDFDQNFGRKLVYLVRKADRKGVKLVFSYFNHGLTHDNYIWKSDEIAGNWLKILKLLDGKTQHIYIDIANEPTIYPQEWEKAASHIIQAVRASYPDIKIVYGASNYNSLYELSRSTPLPFQNITYAFHFYEPYVFTHQGTVWTGNQNTTTGVPFPHDSLIALPQVAAAALGTEGEINLRDYYQTGTYGAIKDKIGIIAKWAAQHQVPLWCTEYGVTQNADTRSRSLYLNQVARVLDHYQIQGFVWEYQGNFGVRDLDGYWNSK